MAANDAANNGGNDGPPPADQYIFEDDDPDDAQGLHGGARTDTEPKEKEVKLGEMMAETRLLIRKGLPRHVLQSARATAEATLKIINDKAEDDDNPLPAAYTHAARQVNYKGAQTGMIIVAATRAQHVRANKDDDFYSFRVEATSDMLMEAIFDHAHGNMMQVLVDLKRFAAKPPHVTEIFVEFDAGRYDPVGKTLDTKTIVKANRTNQEMRKLLHEFNVSEEGRACGGIKTATIVTKTGTDALTSGGR
jgi:hypothetical protein